MSNMCLESYNICFKTIIDSRSLFIKQMPGLVNCRLIVWNKSWQNSANDGHD